jgi:8-oxo-dGTP diphosphatase
MRQVRAAGGVIVRSGRFGPQVLLVHRPKYEDWTFPKGKLTKGESDEDGAHREVREETGLECELSDELGTTSYRDRHGRPKVVRYWLMQHVAGHFEPNDEVDKILWAGVDEASALLTYDRDREILHKVADHEKC